MLNVFANLFVALGAAPKWRRACSAASTSAGGWEAPVLTQSINCFGDWRTPKSLHAGKHTAQQRSQRKNHRETAIRNAKRSANMGVQNIMICSTPLCSDPLCTHSTFEPHRSREDVPYSSIAPPIAWSRSVFFVARGATRSGKTTPDLSFLLIQDFVIVSFGRRLCGVVVVLLLLRICV